MEKKYLILGLGKSGKAAAFFLLTQKKGIICFDDNLNEDDIDVQNLKKSILITNKFEDINFSDVEKIIISPGINPNHKIIQEANENNIEVISEIELGAMFLKNKTIGITGTNGKTTLTKLIAHILNENNIKAFSLGNVGVPLTAAIDKLNKDDVVVLELSSFQLEAMKTKFLDIAVLINITPDHLDRYKTFEDYAKAKLNIIKFLKEKTVFFTTRPIIKKYLNSKMRLDNSIDVKTINEESDDIAKKVLLHYGLTKDQILKGIKTFKKDKHRIEFVNQINKITFIDDSKATNVHSVIFAVKKIKNPIILIAGGVDKGFSYKLWKRYFKNKVISIFAIGQSADKIKKEMDGFDVFIVSSLREAVEKAYNMAYPDYYILLSPGCASFDMFKNYEHRGDEFKKIVNSLGGEKCLVETQL